MTAAIAEQARSLAADLQPRIDFPEIYGPADELAVLQALLDRIARAFDPQPDGPGEPF